MPEAFRVSDEVCGYGLDDHSCWSHSQWEDQPGETAGPADGAPSPGVGHEQRHGHHGAAGGIRAGSVSASALLQNTSNHCKLSLSSCMQVDIMRPWQQVLETVDYMVAMVIRRGLMSLNDGTQDTEFLLQTWGVFCQWLKENGLQRPAGAVTCEALNKMEVIILLLQKLNTKLKVFTGNL